MVRLYERQPEQLWSDFAINIRMSLRLGERFCVRAIAQESNVLHRVISPPCRLNGKLRAPEDSSSEVEKNFSAKNKFKINCFFIFFFGRGGRGGGDGRSASSCSFMLPSTVRQTLVSSFIHFDYIPPSILCFNITIFY